MCEMNEQKEYVCNGDYVTDIPIILNLTKIEEIFDTKNMDKMISIEYDNGESYYDVFVKNGILTIVDGNSEWGESIKSYTTNSTTTEYFITCAKKYISEHPDSGWLERVTWYV